MGIAQLVADTADESLLCMRGGDMALPKLLWDFLFEFPTTSSSSFEFEFELARSFLISCGTKPSSYLINIKICIFA